MSDETDPSKIPCRHCTFVAKSKAGWSAHMRATHPEHYVNNHSNPPQKKKKRKYTKHKREMEGPEDMTQSLAMLGGSHALRFCPCCGTNLDAVRSALQQSEQVSDLASKVTNRLRELGHA